MLGKLCSDVSRATLRSVQLFVFDQFLNRAHQDRKTTGAALRLQEEDLTLHYGVPSKVVLLKFHMTFPLARALGGAAEPT